MDYNYVRMRNAAANGDVESADRYRILYETGRAEPDRHLADVIIILLATVAIALGLYIGLSVQKSRPNTAENAAVTAEPLETPEPVTQPEGAEGQS